MENQEVQSQATRNQFAPFIVKFVERGSGDVPAKENYLIVGVVNDVSKVLKKEGANIAVDLIDHNALVIHFEKSDIDIGIVDAGVIELIHKKDLIIQILDQDLKSVGAIAIM